MCILGYNKNEMTAVHQLKSYCLPSLAYGCEVRQLRKEDARLGNIAWKTVSAEAFMLASDKV